MAKKTSLAFILIILLLFLGLLIIPHMAGSAELEEETETAELDFDEGYYGQFRGQNRQVIVYNWGEYISDGTDGAMDVNKEFTAATGIEVVYLTFSTNEELYAKLRSGNASYDVVIPSDYMVGRMIEEEMLLPLDHQLLPNYTQIDQPFQESDFDPGGVYSVPYTWGITGIIYNTELLQEGDVVDSWSILWDEDYAGEILMFSNSRDAFGIAQSLLGYPLNTTDPQEWENSLRKLKQQKPLVQAYVMDEIFDKMVGGEATLAPYYAGDAVTMIEDNPNLAFAIPKEGVNIFVDAGAIPVGAPDPEAAHMYLNFLMEPEIAVANSDYIGYATPNRGAMDLIGEEEMAESIVYPPEEDLEKAEYFLSLPRETNLLIDSYWTELLSDDQNYSKLLVPVLLVLAMIGAIGINFYRSKRKRSKQYF